MAASSLSDLTKMPVMPKLPKLEAFTQPKATPSGYIGGAELGPVLSELSNAETQAQMKVGEADIAIEEAKRQEKAKEAEQKAQLVGRMATEARNLPERAALTTAREEFGNMAFVPTKETTQDLAGIFSLISIVGMVVGKGNAQLAMSSMNGMLEGYQKGRADLYKKEQVEFDKNFKAMQSKIATLEKELSEAMELKKLDREKGELEITMALAKVDSPVLNKMRERLGDVAVVNSVQGIKKDIVSTANLINDLQGKADARADAAAARAQAERLSNESNRRADVNAKLARDQALALAKIKAKEGGFLKPGAKVTEGYTADVILKNDLQGLSQDLKNPKLIQQLKQYRVEAFLTEEGKVLNQLLASEIPPDLLQFLTKVRDIRNNYYLNISGKAVTGGEALRSYGAVPQPGDDAQGMLNKVGGMAKRIDDSIQLKRQLYGLPEINLREGIRTNLNPGQDYSRDETQKSLPTGDKLKTYADQHHGGDVNKATSYLQSQGYR
jgi:hypothetical protein